MIVCVSFSEWLPAVISVLSVCVELLVAAHQCFTLACSMDGIAAVLHTARTLTFTLEQGDEFNLMVRPATPNTPGERLSS